MAENNARALGEEGRPSREAVKMELRGIPSVALRGREPCRHRGTENPEPIGPLLEPEGEHRWLLRDVPEHPMRTDHEGRIIESVGWPPWRCMS